MKVICVVFTALGVFVLGWILGMLAWKGVGALSGRLFVEVTPGPGSEGGGLGSKLDQGVA
jgi:phosphate transport system permease protein